MKPDDKPSEKTEGEEGEEEEEDSLKDRFFFNEGSQRFFPTYDLSVHEHEETDSLIPSAYNQVDPVFEKELVHEE